MAKIYAEIDKNNDGLIGWDEFKEGKANVKNMKNGEQNLLSISEMITLLKQ